MHDAAASTVGAHLACVEATLHPPHVVIISVYSIIHLLNVYSQIVGLQRWRDSLVDDR